MLYSIIGMLVIIFDQVVKYWVDKNINWTNPVRSFIPGVLSLVRVQNDGAAFSFLSGGSARIAFIVITAVFAVLVVLALATNFVSGRFGRWCLVFITAGGIANLIDRVRFGYVIDMFKVELFDFAVFNVADIFITVFCIAFIIYILFGGEKVRDTEPDDYDVDDYEDEDRPRKARSKAVVYEDDEDMPRRAPRRKMPAAEQEEDSPAPRKRAARLPANDNTEESAPRTRKRSPANEETEVPAVTKRRRSTTEEAPVKKPARRPTEADAEAEPSKKSSPRKPAEETAQPSPRRATRKAANSEDPFAEWEQANARINASRSKAESTASATGSATGEVDAFSEYLAAKTAPAKKTAPVVKKAASSPVVDQEKKKPAKPAAVSSADDFDLDSILNEFK